MHLRCLWPEREIWKKTTSTEGSEKYTITVHDRGNLHNHIVKDIKKDLEYEKTL